MGDQLYRKDTVWRYMSCNWWWRQTPCVAHLLFGPPGITPEDGMLRSGRYKRLSSMDCRSSNQYVNWKWTQNHNVNHNALLQSIHKFIHWGWFSFVHLICKVLFFCRKLSIYTLKSLMIANSAKLSYHWVRYANMYVLNVKFAWCEFDLQ